MLPDEFDQFAEAATFTNGKDDRPLVKRLYREHFCTEFANIKALAWLNLGWDAADVKRAMEKLSTVALPRLVVLHLGDQAESDEHGNIIGEAGIRALTYPGDQ